MNGCPLYIYVCIYTVLFVPSLKKIKKKKYQHRKNIRTYVVDNIFND